MFLTVLTLVEVHFIVVTVYLMFPITIEQKHKVKELLNQGQANILNCVPALMSDGVISLLKQSISLEHPAVQTSNHK